MLDKIDGTTWTYTTNNYDVDSTKPTTSTYYVIQSGTSLTLSSLCTAPTIPSSRKITSVWNPGTSAASNVASANATNTTYACWYDRNTYTLTLTKWTWISSVSNGWTNTESAKTYKYGKQVSISATANTSAWYSFSNWTKNSGDAPANANSASTTVTITQNTQLTANANDIQQIMRK